jgi:hypothetical protein
VQDTFYKIDSPISPKKNFSISFRDIGLQPRGLNFKPQISNQNKWQFQDFAADYKAECIPGI